MMDYLGTVQRIEQMFDSACQRSRIGGEVHCDIRSKGTPPLHTRVVARAANGTYAGAVFQWPGDFMTTPLDPVIAQIIPLLPLRDPATMTPQSARDQLRALAASRAAVPPPPVAGIEETQVKGAAGPLAARVYRVSNEKSPAVVFFHGGGWVAGDLETHDRQARLLAIETGAVVVSVDYRRPPETRFPGAFEDAFAAVRDVIARIAGFGGDSAHVGVAGDSAGGNLAAAVAIACRDAGIHLAAQLLVYPVTDVAGNYADANENARFPSRAENAEGYFLSRAVMEWFAGHYLADARDGADWRVSPLRAKSLTGLAPAVVCTAWFDPLRDEGKAYAEALAAAGVATKYHHGAGLIHGYFGLGDASAAARREAQHARADFKTLLARGA
jgi:acetyl esterase